MTDEEVSKELIAPTIENKKRGRPAGSKNKPKVKVIKGTETDKVYRYYFIAKSCGCRIGANVRGSGMWCQHGNSMNLEDHKGYTETDIVRQ